MKYVESLFDVLYLIFAILSGILIERWATNRAQKMMGLATLILGCGDAFHLVPRVLNYFMDGDFTAFLGVGKLITSITMTLFYLLMYYIAISYYKLNENRYITYGLYGLTLIRIILCLLPQNGWLTNSSDMAMGIIRNIPFVMIGAYICYLYYLNRNKEKTFSKVWLFILLSFLFYMPVAVLAGEIKILGMLMLPKTVCYIMLIVCFLKTFNKE